MLCRRVAELVFAGSSVAVHKSPPRGAVGPQVAADSPHGRGKAPWVSRRAGHVIAGLALCVFHFVVVTAAVINKGTLLWLGLLSSAPLCSPSGPQEPSRTLSRDLPLTLKGEFI